MILLTDKTFKGSVFDFSSMSTRAVITHIINNLKSPYLLDDYEIL